MRTPRLDPTPRLKPRPRLDPAHPFRTADRDPPPVARKKLGWRASRELAAQRFEWPLGRARRSCSDLHRTQAPAVLDHSLTLPQGDGCAGSAFAGAGDGNALSFLYDTFEGMTEPDPEVALDPDGNDATNDWLEVQRRGVKWSYAPIEEVRDVIAGSGYPMDKVVFVKGPVEDTIPTTVPDRISLLRLDTDWYSSTKHEIEHLYPVFLCRASYFSTIMGITRGRGARSTNISIELENVRSSFASIIHAGPQ